MKTTNYIHQGNEGGLCKRYQIKETENSQQVARWIDNQMTLISNYVTKLGDLESPKKLQPGQLSKAVPYFVFIL